MQEADIALRTFVVARWVLLLLVAGMAGADGAGILPGDWFGGVEPSATIPIVLTLCAWAGHNAWATAVTLRRGHVQATTAGAHLLVDAAALTIVFAWAGGGANPFTVLYFLPITLATQLSARWTAGLAVSCLAGFALLFVVSPVPVHSGPHARHFAGHLQGMWVAFGLAGALITVFVHRVAVGIEREREELARVRREALEDRHVAAIGALAAGAAHELGTPLGSIAMLTSDLDRMDSDERKVAIEEIQRQIARSKDILSGLANPELRASDMAVDEPAWPLGELASPLQAVADDVTIRITVDTPAAMCEQPRASIVQILRELVTNAAAACRAAGSGGDVRIDIETADGTVGVIVEDEGAGMDEATLARAFDPFVSDHRGQGLGLGLFLVRAHLRQLGGAIDVSSRPGRGTRVHVRFPLERSGR